MATTISPDPVVDGAVQDIGPLVSELRVLHGTGRTAGVAWRRRQLEGIVRFMTEREAEIAGALAQDLGKPAMTAFLGEIARPRAEAKHALKRLGSWTKPRRAAVPAAFLPGKAWSQAEPKGVVLILAPWNFPVLLCMDPLVSAVAAGNAVVVKPSEMAPAVSAVLAKHLPRYLDPDAVKVVEGGIEASTALLEQRFDHILYTGSGRVGRIVMEAAAKHLTPVTLELGGKSPTIVTRNADLAVAAKRIAWAKATAAGQACVAPDYVLVERQARPAFMAALLEEFASIEKYGETTRIVDDRNARRLTALLQGHGGEVVTEGGSRADGTFRPVVIADPDPSSAVMQEEIFGPILPIVEVESLDQAITFVREREKPLALYLFSKSRAEERAVLDLTSSGSVCVNHVFYQIMLPDLPFGGVGESGMGAYHGRTGFETFSHRKAVLRKPGSFDPAMGYPPFEGVVEKLTRFLFR